MNEMSDQVRGIIFVVLVLVVIFAWSHFFTPAVPPPQKQAQTSSQKAQLLPEIRLRKFTPASPPAAAPTAVRSAPPLLPLRPSKPPRNRRLWSKARYTAWKFPIAAAW